MRWLHSWLEDSSCKDQYEGSLFRFSVVACRKLTRAPRLRQTTNPSSQKASPVVVSHERTSVKQDHWRGVKAQR